MNKRILITGVRGNIGKPLKAHLLSKGYEVMGVDIFPGYSDDYMMANINIPAEVEVVFKSFKPTHVIHAAALYGRLANERYKYDSIQTNVAGTNNIAQLCKDYVCHMVFLSSSEVYGDRGLLLREDMLLLPNNRYGLSKKLAEEIIQYELANGLKGIILRLNMAITPTEDTGVHRSAMIRFCEAALNKEKIEVHDKSTRSWMHINDVVEYIERAMEWGSFYAVNVASDEQVETLDVAKYIYEKAGLNPNDFIKVVPLPAKMTQIKNLDTTLLKSWTDFMPRYTWKQIADETLENLKERNK